MNKLKNKFEIQEFLVDESIENFKQYIMNAKLEAKSRFNIFKVLKLDNHEIRHSNFLAWLLNPKANHGFEELFLKEFLTVALNKENIIKDFSDIIIDTEYLTNAGRRIDIIMHSEKSKFVCVIENKYGSDEHDEQCKHYKDFIENHSKFRNYGKENQYYIFLDINMPSEDQLQNELSCYKPVTYKDVDKILCELLKSAQEDYTTQTIKQYTEILKEKYNMLDIETKKQCQNLYCKYSEIFDTMEEYKESLYSDLYEIMKEFLTKYNAEFENADRAGCGYLDKARKQSGIRFVPTNIYKVGTEHESNNIHTKYPVFFALNYDKQLYLDIICVNSKQNWKNMLENPVKINIAQSSDKIINEIYEKAKSLNAKFENSI